MFRRTKHPSVSKAIDQAKKDVAPKGPGEPPKEDPKAKFKREVEEQVQKGPQKAADFIQVGNLVRKEADRVYDSARATRMLTEKGKLAESASVAMDQAENISVQIRQIQATPEFRSLSSDEAEKLIRSQGIAAAYDKTALALIRTLQERRAALMKRHRENWAKIHELDAQVGALQAASYREALRDVRDFGPKGAITEPKWNPGSAKKAKAALAANLENLPTDWLVASRLHGGLNGKAVRRGYYDRSNGNFAITKYGNGPEFLRSEARVGIHEFGHRAEHIFPDIMDAEVDFYRRRTANDPLKHMGKGYQKDEVYREDRFVEKYMGKDYSARDNGNWFYTEILTMGLEGVFYGQYDLETKDPEFLDFILGLLVAGGRP